jgi:hypothetical protein
MNIFEQIKQNFNNRKGKDLIFPIAPPSMEQVNNILEGKEDGGTILFSLSSPTIESRITALEAAIAELALKED